jgi:hypothetical protein
MAIVVSSCVFVHVLAQRRVRTRSVVLLYWYKCSIAGGCDVPACQEIFTTQLSPIKN